ncbi:MAG: VIT domain-containing protein, partial [Planctomycetota bacterium]
MICAHGTRYAAAAAALAAAFSLQPGFTPRAQGAGLLIADGGLGGVLTIEQHTARVTINNGVAVTEVEQTFRNTEDRQVEALYVFPVPRGASVANFSMWIGGKEMVGEVVEKQRAKQVYESYKQTNTDPGLLEQKDYKTFEMRVFPIAPRGEQRVRVCYYQELDYDANRATYVYPLASSASGAGAGASAGGGRAGGEKAGRLSLSFRVLSETPVTSLESPSHAGEFAVAQHSPHFCEASYEARGGRLDRDFVLSYETARAQ